MKRIKQWWHDVKEMAAHGTGYEIVNGNKNSPRLIFLWLILMAIWYSAGHQVKRAVCKVRGHNWVSEDDGGPDGGHISGHCERCDFSIHHTLY